MRIIIFSENLLFNNGGAETYALKLGEILVYHLGYINTRILTYKYLNKNTLLISDVFKKYDIKPINVKIINTLYSLSFLRIIIRIYNVFAIWLSLKKGDIFINCSANRLIGSRKSKNIHIIHFPVKSYSSFIPIRVIASFLDKKYKNSYAYFLTNSKFTNIFLKNYWNIEGQVVYHPTAINEYPIDFSIKRKQIIIVGRIVPDKKIKEMVYAYINRGIAATNYNLLIIGNRDTNYLWYLDELRTQIKDYKSIVIKTDISTDELRKYYLESDIFWHGKGYGVEETNPLEMEHFGMTTVEAMACGCIPIVINKAGQREIVEQNISGYLWDTLDELTSFSIKVINDETLKSNLSHEAYNRSHFFSIRNHAKRYLDIISSLVSVK